jgi:hypothetical protein
VAQKLRKYTTGGTDPECVAVSPDGHRLYLSNEEAGTASIVDVGTGARRATLIVWATAEIGGTVMEIDANPDGLARMGNRDRAGRTEALRREQPVEHGIRHRHEDAQSDRHDPDRRRPVGARGTVTPHRRGQAAAAWPALLPSLRFNVSAFATA